MFLNQPTDATLPYKTSSSKQPRRLRKACGPRTWCLEEEEKKRKRVIGSNFLLPQFLLSCYPFVFFSLRTVDPITQLHPRFQRQHIFFELSRLLSEFFSWYPDCGYCGCKPTPNSWMHSLLCSCVLERSHKTRY
ncbi:hypothetical protein PVAG01_11158 [Phlyctema vagabunda]|uniref:Uncharacterized protein n=1 Tax=Phlyctema vagabunda TaxID=108571 RepID=A0ABR4P1I3_9HELO